MQRKKIYLAVLLSGMIALALGGCRPQEEIRTVGLAEDSSPYFNGEEGAEPDSSQTETQKTEASQMETAQTEAFQTEREIFVHVCGAVKQPGVYSLREGMRVYEAVALAGGFLEDADTDWTNQAELVTDGQKLRIYTRAETAGMQQTEALPEVTAEDGTETAQGKVNLNTADRETLMTLPGIGEAKADAIIAYRSEQGAFRSIEEIQNISGIKSAVFSKIKDRITIE